MGLDDIVEANLDITKRILDKMEELWQFVRRVYVDAIGDRKRIEELEERLTKLEDGVGNDDNDDDGGV